MKASGTEYYVVYILIIGSFVAFFFKEHLPADIRNYIKFIPVLGLLWYVARGRKKAE